MKLTTAEETYLQTIHQLSNGSNVSTNTLAKQMGVAPASVTDMVQKLADKEFIQYEKYRGVCLLPTGLRIAKQLNKTKEIWKEFLMNHLLISEKETQQLIDELQHIQSNELRANLQTYLTKQSPKNELLSNYSFEELIEEKKTEKPLTIINAIIGQTYQINGIKELTEEITELLLFHELILGAELIVKKQFAVNHQFLVQFKDKDRIISKELASLILVSPK